MLAPAKGVKKVHRKRNLVCDELVRLKGFEPPTFWFVAKHSIQLSYSRIPYFGFSCPLSLTATLV